jgi:hypothetical protein
LKETKLSIFWFIGAAMLVNSVPVDVVGGAYQIAANYLKNAGRIPYELDIHQPLLDTIVEDYRAGNRNVLRLANRAIARIEKANALKLISCDRAVKKSARS